jgi:hypothetical protein
VDRSAHPALRNFQTGLKCGQNIGLKMVFKNWAKMPLKCCQNSNDFHAKFEI